MENVGGFVGEVIPDTIGKFVDDSWQLLLCQVDRTGVDMHHLEAGFDGHTGRKIPVPATDIDRCVRAAVRKGSSKLAHIDVHAAGIAAAWLHQR